MNNGLTNMKTLLVLVLAALFNGCCAYYDGWGWQPCAGYTHNAHDSYTQSLPVKNKQ
jgi:hypothetical protein